MSGNHITIELLESIYSNAASPETLLKRALQHLGDLCPHCHEQMRSFAERRFAGKGLTELDLSVLLKTIEEWTGRLDLLRKQAHEEFEELMQVMPEKRRGKISRATKRFRSPILADLLLDESRRQIFDNPDQSFELADLAHVVALQVNVQRYGITLAYCLLTKAGAYKANALRVQGSFQAADALMEWSLGRLNDCSDPLVLGEVYSLAASLRKDEQRVDEALQFLMKAVDIYRDAASPTLIGKTLVTLGEVCWMMRKPNEALKAVREALTILTPESEPRVYACARHNVAWYLADAGRFEEARSEFEINQSYYPLFPAKWLSIRRTYLEGRIAAGFGEVEAAEKMLREAKQCLARGF